MKAVFFPSYQRGLKGRFPVASPQANLLFVCPDTTSKAKQVAALLLAPPGDPMHGLSRVSSSGHPTLPYKNRIWEARSSSHSNWQLRACCSWFVTAFHSSLRSQVHPSRPAGKTKQVPSKSSRCEWCPSSPIAPVSSLFQNMLTSGRAG